MTTTTRLDGLAATIDAANRAGVRRNGYYDLVERSLADSAGEPPQIRRALAWAYVLDHVDLVILDDEEIVGSHLGLFPVMTDLPPFEERLQEARDVVERYREERIAAGDHFDRSRRGAFTARIHYEGSIEFADLQRIYRVLEAEYADDPVLSMPEIKREVHHHFDFDFSRQRRAMDGVPIYTGNHIAYEIEQVLAVGFDGMLAVVREKGREADREAEEFYRAVEIVLESAKRFIARYADAAEREATAHERGEADAGPDVYGIRGRSTAATVLSADPTRARELRETAAVLRSIAGPAPQTFREALQLAWIIHVIGNMQNASALSLGLLDRYLAPFYDRDVAAGTLTAERAREWLATAFLKVNEPKMRIVQSVCVGGTLPDGSSAASEVTRRCIEAVRLIRQPYPNLAVRVAANSPDWVYDEIALTMQAGIAHPMVLNDDVWVPNLVREGHAFEDAVYYYNMGCVEILLQGRTVGWRGAGGGYDFPGIFEMLFRPDARNRAGQQGLPVDLSSLSTFDDFLNAYLAELTHLIDTKLPPSVAQGEAEDARRYDAFASAFTLDCLDRGRDMHHGGARYPAIRNAGGFGLGTAVDSLVAVKRTVYDEQRVSLDDLRAAILADFDGHEALRRTLAASPAFGVDDAEADAIAKRVFDHFCDTVHLYNEKLDAPGRVATVFFSYNRHVDMGEIIIATPNGRRSGEPMSDAIGPTQGRDVEGPTALMRSVLKLDPSKVTGAFALNMKLSAQSVEGQTGLDALKALVRTYVAAKGVQMQVNVVDAEELREAQLDPDAHRGLIVRVAGYSEFFCNLDKGLQDEIIARTAHAAS